MLYYIEEGSASKVGVVCASMRAYTPQAERGKKLMQAWKACSQGPQGS